MKQIIQKTSAFTALVLIAFSAVLSSFAVKPGGEGFEIYLDGKVVLQRFGNELNNVQSLQLDPRSTAGQLSVKYHHCGKVGRNKQVVIKDAQNNLLKEWHFEDAKEAYAPMNFSVKEILGLQKGTRGSKVNLYYSSTELPKGRLLASLVLPAKNLTTP